MRDELPSPARPPPGFGYGVPVYGGFGGGGLLSLLFWGAFAVIMIQVLQGVLRGKPALTSLPLRAPPMHPSLSTRATPMS